MLAVIEIKASERKESRLGFAEVERDIRKLAAHREEVQCRHHYEFHPVMLVLDSAPEKSERMDEAALSKARKLANDLRVEWRYLSPEQVQADRPLLLETELAT